MSENELDELSKELSEWEKVGERCWLKKCSRAERPWIGGCWCTGK